MSIQASWYEPRQIILLQMVGQVTLDEMEKANRSIAQLLQDGLPPHLLVDFSHLEGMPMSLKDGIHHSHTFADSRIGWIAAYALPNRAVRMLGTLFSQMMRIHLKNFDTQQEAITFLQGLERQ
jgi:hypothetical protein